MRMIKAVKPYIHPEYLNFKTAPYQAWVKSGGQTAEAHYPARMLHGWAFRYELPTIFRNTREVRLRFVEPVSVTFDTFPDYARYEIIPMIWDCWPCYFEKMCRWLEKHQVRTAIFTSSQTAERVQSRFSKMNIMYCPEAVDASCYQAGTPLAERSIDLLEFGRSNGQLFRSAFPKRINHVCTNQNGRYIYDNEELYEAMSQSKITVALPRSITHPKLAGDIETLTQRYWEGMLSRIVMVGYAPKELVDLIGYNPVVELDTVHATEQIQDILSHIDDYQELVNRNRTTALQYGDWSMRMKDVMNFLQQCGYEL